MSRPRQQRQGFAIFPNPHSSLQEAREWTEQEKWKDGAICPCCAQPAKVYPWKLIFRTAVGLRDFYRLDRLTPGRYWHRADAMRVSTHPDLYQSGAVVMGHRWELLEEKSGTPESEAEEEDKFKDGFWRITQLGRDFVEDKVKMPKTLLLYNNKVVGRIDHPLVSFSDSLSVKFSRKQMMGRSDVLVNLALRTLQEKKP
ncbi:MAG: hypothetical protein WC729_29195 [Sphingomonas sp.]|jgi:hypothetical protein|uniref:hypothetical protein n=1 Tax=Sphingomonas sp. TaxID=28214 RepID=UPI00356AA2E9